jgi:hypothetical protein
VKDFMQFDRLAAAQLLKLAVILHETYQSIDLAALALSVFDSKEGTALQPAYLQRFQRPNG